MVTHFIDESTVRAYLRDLLARLHGLNPPPDVLCPITHSGTALFRLMLKMLPEECPSLAGSVPIISLAVDDGTDTVRYSDHTPDFFVGKRVFLFDGAIHSGRMLNICTRELTERGVAEICSYSLVVKRSASFIPTFWSLMIDDTDRAFFQLDTIPNHRLHSGSAGKPQLYVHLRLLLDTDIALRPIMTGVNSLDRVTWGDRLFNTRVFPARRTYLLQTGPAVAAFLTITLEQPGILYVDEVAVDRQYQGQASRKLGPILMRFADTLARHHDCHAVRLHSIDSRVGFYEGFGYKVVASSPPIPLDTNTYQLMERPLLYHLPDPCAG